MTTAASDDLIARVRAYLAGLELPVPADELTDEEVTARVSEILQPYARFVEYGTNPPPPRPFLRRLLDPATPPEPPPRPR
jgi:hypothetical protein